MQKVQSSFPPLMDIALSEVRRQGGGGGGVGGVERQRGNGDYRVTSALFLPPGPEKQEVLHIRHYCDGAEMQGPLK